ncbi:MAG: hypothetical protein WBP13_06375 [Methylophilaceae bacterium]
MTIYQKHIEQVWFTYGVTNKTSGSVRCEKCQSDLAVTDWTDDIEAFYLKTAKETTLEKTSKHYTWLAKLAIALIGVLLLTIVLAFVFNDKIKAHSAARKLAEQNRQDVVLHVGDKIQLSYEHLYMNFHQGQDKGKGVTSFEVVKETKKTYLLDKIKSENELSDVKAVNASGLKQLFELKKAKTGDFGFTVVGLNGAEGLYTEGEITKVRE